ncbi:hypothetical protein [Actinocorallia longicatena]|uniref:LPXTG-motif cell wall-anchored protein n=1 Tax=Actinocorallia longicatena TaxID=111803 RepID=A0ABP6QIB0_9ACTN
MQPVRVIIAAIFFVIGALIVIPAFTSGGKNTSNADPVPTTMTPTVTPTVTPTTAKPTGKPTATKTASPTPSKTPSKTPTPTPRPTTSRPVPPVTPSATPSRSTPVPSAPSLVPLKVAFGKVDCPARLVTIKVVNEDPATTQGYSIVRDGSIVLADQLGPKASRSSELTLKEDKATSIRITQDGKAKATHTYKANCKAAPSKSAAEEEPARKRPTTLPKTGNDDTVMFARIATGAASMLTGAIVLWWGGLWPRRKDKMLG